MTSLDWFLLGLGTGVIATMLCMLSDIREQRRRAEAAQRALDVSLGFKADHSVVDPTPAQIDQLTLELGMIGIKVPGRDTAFFQSAVRKWVADINQDQPDNLAGYVGRVDLPEEGD